jgi:hypothetical protein
MKQKVVKISGSILIVALIGFIFYHVHSIAGAITAAQYTCQSNGTYGDITDGPATLTTSDETHAASALSWLTSMTNTSTVVTTASTVTPSQEFDPTYTGPISGTFNLVGATYPIVSDASIEIDSPTTVPDDYAGVVSGKVLETPTANRWIIQVYKLTSSGEVQVAKQALADGTTGDFSIDLSTIASPPTGSWEFGILDANNSYAPYGTKWPSAPYYQGLQVQQKVVTDAIYDWSTTNALADGTFSFPNSNTGKKLFRLVDTATGDILAEHVVTTGLIRSFELDPSDPAYGTGFAQESYVYDQATSLFAAMGTNDQSLADTLVNGMLLQQQTTGPYAGGFVFSTPQLSPSYRDAQIRTGAHAIATDALLAYIGKYPNAANITTLKAAAISALTFMNGLLSTSGTTAGLYLGGYGDYSGTNGAFDPTVVIPWASTEHNIDAWEMYKEASLVLGDTAVNYTQLASTLNDAIVSKLYNATEQRYYQGMQPDGPDTSDPLDVNTWGAMQMYSSGRYDEAIAALGRLGPFTFTSGGVTGYAAFYDSPTSGYPGAVPTVWYEGSFGAALAMYRVGNYDGYRTLLNSIETGQQNDGSYQYATDEDPTYDITTRKAVSSTAWSILATTGRSAIWNVCQYNPPIDPIVAPTVPTPSDTTTTATPATNATQGMTSNNDAPAPTTTGATSTTPNATSTPTKTTATTSATKPGTFNWTPVVVAGSSIASVGIIWALVALIRSRLL